MRRKREDYRDNVQVVFVVLTFQHSRQDGTPFETPVVLNVETFSEERRAVEAAMFDTGSSTEVRSTDATIYRGELKESRIYTRYMRM